MVRSAPIIGVPLLRREHHIPISPDTIRDHDQRRQLLRVVLTDIIHTRRVISPEVAHPFRHLRTYVSDLLIAVLDGLHDLRF
jgi:hypothetical protein